MEESIPHEETIANFPAINAPILNSTMKEMLVSLCVNITASLRQVRSDIDDLENIIDYVETKMEELASSFNTLVDSQSDKGDDNVWMKAKLVDLKDRSPRNNLKIRGISESVLPDKLPALIQFMLRSVLSKTSPMELVVDRIHCLPRPYHLSNNISRDVILQLHFFHIK